MRPVLIIDLILIAANAAGVVIQEPCWASVGNAFVAGLLISSAVDDLIRKGWRRSA